MCFAGFAVFILSLWCFSEPWNYPCHVWMYLCWILSLPFLLWIQKRDTAFFGWLLSVLPRCRLNRQFWHGELCIFTCPGLKVPPLLGQETQVFCEAESVGGNAGRQIFSSPLLSFRPNEAENWLRKWTRVAQILHKNLKSPQTVSCGPFPLGTLCEQISAAVWSSVDLQLELCTRRQNLNCVCLCHHMAVDLDPPQVGDRRGAPMYTASCSRVLYLLRRCELEFHYEPISIQHCCSSRPHCAPNLCAEQHWGQLSCKMSCEKIPIRPWGIYQNLNLDSQPFSLSHDKGVMF